LLGDYSLLIIVRPAERRASTPEGARSQLNEWKDLVRIEFAETKSILISEFTIFFFREPSFFCSLLSGFRIVHTLSAH